MNEKPNIVVPALVGGLFLGITSALPLLNLINCACCALVIGGGILASFMYLRDYPAHFPTATYGDAAVLGILTGVFGGIIWAVVSLPLSLLKFRLGAGMQQLDRLREELNKAQLPPALRQLLQQLMAGGAMSIGIVLLQLGIDLIVSVVFAVVGAVIGFALFQKRPRYTPPPATCGPPPPPIR